MQVQIKALVVAPSHRMSGRPRDGMAPATGPEDATTARVRAHRGIVGDRYFGTRSARAAVTMIATESIEQLERDLGAGPFDPALSRRNLVVEGFDVDALVRCSFTLDAGHGPIRFRSFTPASPCAWMNEVFAPGAHQALRGHAGIRCEPLDDGQISVGPATITDVAPLAPHELKRPTRAAATNGQSAIPGL
ncbi:MOSC domain-containing protein [Aeromicrobium alkaliterrae]|uniref:MOSC domain-containing protein n=1 Tax=Aeromicrobium alkaliterrae TaxID=302168 RepID=A0ABP4W9L7_9ACTN